MARKPRDHKAEYARAKQRAQREGYKSQRARKQAHRQLKSIKSAQADTFAGFTIKRDVQSEVWSMQHSRKETTQYNPDWSEKQKNDYYQTFVGDYRKTRKKDILAYLTEWYPEKKDEWLQIYEG